MDKDVWTREMFQRIDERDVDAFVGYLAQDVSFRFANAEPIIGKAAVGQMLSGFLDSIRGISHELLDVWEVDDVVICRGTVTYTRKDSSTLTVPFADILKLEDERIREYLVYVDVSDL